MDYRQLVRTLAAGRIFIGTTLVLFPGFAASQWIGSSARETEVKVLTRAMGVRDLALGAGTLQALETGESARSWVLMGALSDAVDLVATGVAIRRIGLRRALPVMAVAATAVAVSVTAADRLD